MPKNPEAPSGLYRTVRGQIEHINNNLGPRIIWLVIAQSFFFSAYAILTTGKTQLPMNDRLYESLLMLVPVASMLSIVFTYMDIVASLWYMTGLRRYYEQSPKDEEVERAYPAINGTTGQRVFQYTSPLGLPLVFLVCWIILLNVHIREKRAHPMPPPPASAPAPPPPNNSPAQTQPQ